MSADRSRSQPGVALLSPAWRRVAWAIGLVAFLARLVPVLRGGGLYGLGNYDDGVHYSAALGLVHGRLPYRDFLFLHPPGIVLALAPFAALGRLIGDANGMAAARLTWMLLGGLSAVLVSRLLWRAGTVPAVVGGCFYAVYFPAVYVEHTALLEGLASTCVAAALVLMTSRAGQPVRHRAALLAGVLLGASATIKMWGVVVLLAVACWALVTHGRRCAAALVAAAAVCVTAVCLPFFLKSPSVMWRYVITDQLGRPVTGFPAGRRLADISGLQVVGQPPPAPALVLTVLCLFSLAMILAWSVRPARLAVVVLLSSTLLLLVTPSWFEHYAGLISVPLATAVGAAVDPPIRWLSGRPRRLKLLAAGLLILALAGYAAPLAQLRLGRAFPAQRLAAVVAPLPGCITTDSPITLIEMNVLNRNLERGCPLVSDMSGYSYDRPVLDSLGRAVPRSRNEFWQRHVMTYLRSGTAVIIIRFYSEPGFNATSAAVAKSWPTLIRVGPFSLQRPR